MFENRDRREDEATQKSISRREMVAFALRAARRHVALCIAVGVACGALATAVVLVIPPVYQSNAKVFVAPSANLTVELTSPMRPGTLPVDPLKGLSETLYRRDNLEAIVRETKLLEAWDRNRSPALRYKDRLMAAVLGPVTREEKLRILVAMLEKHLSIWAEDGTSIRFRAEWRDPETARKLVAIAKRNFLRSRNSSEHAAITTAIAIVEDEVKRAAEAIDPALRDAQRVREKHGSGTSSAAAQGAEPARSPLASVTLREPALPRAESASLTARLEEVRRMMRELREPWQRRLAELRFQQAELRASYGPAHPAVIQQDAKIQQASSEPPELVRLTQEERSLLATLSGLASAPRPTTVAPVARAERSAGSPARGESTRAGEARDEPEVSAALAQFAAALQRYNELNARLDGARLELTTAQAAFNYRYVVVSEPERSRDPIRPRRGLLLLAGLAASVALGLIAGGLRELVSGRVVEGWQLKRLGLPVLAEVDLTEHRSR